jgi:hypothetical protein
MPQITSYTTLITLAVKCCPDAKSDQLANSVSRACSFLIFSAFDMAHLQEGFFLER